MALTDTSTLTPKTRVVATTKLPGVPEGTTGKVGRSVGLRLARYRVAFDNGVNLSSVTHRKLVCEDEWDEYQEQRQATAEAEAAGKTTEEEEETGDSGSPEAAPPADDRLAALLAKSKAAKAKKLAEAGG